MAGAVFVKIVWFIDHLRPDGTQRVLTQLVEGLSQRGHQHAVVCVNDSWDAQVVESLRACRCEVRIIGKAALVTGIGVIQTLRWLRNERFDAAVTLLFYSDVIGRTLAHAAGVPRIVTSIRARNVDYSRWQRWLDRITMKWADQVVINSAGIREYVQTQVGVRTNALVLVPNGVNIPDLPSRSERSHARETLGIRNGAIVIGSVGRLEPQKGYDLLIQAYRYLEPDKPYLLIIGNGSQEGDLREQIARDGLTEKVFLLGYRRDVLDIYPAIDLYVQPSRFEGMPNALMEAMAAGLPVIATAVDGNCELIEDGCSGWLAPAGDAEGLASVISSAIRKSDEARRRGEEGRARVCVLFPLEKMVSRWETLLVN
jgi:glycosyltransferase involved in cell wall biosynthesis